MNDLINLSLCMIVRDNERTIRPCLESIAPWVDEIVIVDTGSIDSTPEIVKSFGARLFHKSWTDDFSEARNFSIDNARGKWVFWMDSDDTIPALCGEKLKQLARSGHPENVLGYVMQVRCPSQSGSASNEFTVVDHVKLFRNRPELRFEGPIHEQLMMPIRRLGGEIGWTDIYVVHSGSEQTPESQKRKVERDLRILRKDLESRPNHPFVLFNFAMTFAEAHQYDDALGWIEKCLAASQPHESHVRKAYAYLANCLFQLGRPQEALGACKQGRQIYPDDPELLFREAMICHEIGELEESITRYREILDLPQREVFQSTDPGIRGFKCRFNLGVALRDANRLDEAESQWRTVLRERPGYRPACRAIVELLLSKSRVTAAKVEAGKLTNSPSTHSEGLLLTAQIFEHQRDLDQAEQILDQCIELFPGDEQVLEDNSRFHFTHSNLEKARTSLELLVKEYPTNAAAHHNLGAVCFQQENYDQATSSLRSSLHLRPNSIDTLQLYELVTNTQSSRIEPVNRHLQTDSKNLAPTISVKFCGDILDLVPAARILSVYSAQGCAVEVQCLKEHELIFKSCGATIVEVARNDWSLIPSPYRPTLEHIKEWQVNNAGWNLSAPPLPRIGSAEKLWNDYCRSELDVESCVPAGTKKRMASWLGNAPRPIVALSIDPGGGENHFSDLDVDAFCNNFLKRFSGTLIVLDANGSNTVLQSSRVKRLVDFDRYCSIAALFVVLDQSDLLVASNSLALQLAALTMTPAVAIWEGDMHPANCSFPSEKQLNLVCADAKQRKNRCWRVPWNIIEYAGRRLDPQQLLNHCSAMMGEQRYLPGNKIAADAQMQYWIRMCHEEGTPVRDRDRSFDRLFQEIRSRFDNPTIVETGTIRAEEDWSGAGFFTWLAGAYAFHSGGALHSVDIDPANCAFANQTCKPFGQSVKIHCDDSVAFLKDFSHPIDVLYCDSLDSYEPGFEQHVLNEVIAAMPHLHSNSLVVFDDSPTMNGVICAKGTLAVPWLLDQGWRVLFAGYQVVLFK